MRFRRCTAKPLDFATDAFKPDGKVPVQHRPGITDFLLLLGNWG